MSAPPIKADLLRRNQKIRFAAEAIPPLKPTGPVVVKTTPSLPKKPFPIPVKGVPVM